MLNAKNTVLALSAGTTLFGLVAVGCSGNDPKGSDPNAGGDGVAQVGSGEAAHEGVVGGAAHEFLGRPKGGANGAHEGGGGTAPEGGTGGTPHEGGMGGAGGGAGAGGGTDPGTGAAPGDAGAPPNPAGLSLKVVGNHLVDGNGAVVRLLGVDRSGQEFKCIQGGSPGSLGWGIFDGPTDLPSAQAIASWNANAVRLPLNEDCWLGINGVNPAYGGPAYQQAIEAYVATLHQAGLYVIVDLHWNAPGGVAAASQQPLPDADHAVTFWTSVASAFAADPAVVLDLYNEPFLYGTYLEDPGQDPWDCWLNGCGLNQYLTGGTPYTLPLAWNAVGMQPLVTAVRATGAKNPIMIGGLAWANDLSGWLAHQPQDPEQAIVASWHSYPGESCATEACWSSIVAPVAAQVPVVTGEVGDNVCSAASYVPTLLPWANAAGVSYLGWTWNTWGDCANILITDYAGTPTANYGQAFKTLLAATQP
jgi:endoglucanase